MLGYYQGLVEALPDLHMCLPGITFPGELALHGDQWTARLVTFDGGHTGSDTLLHIPKAGVAFLSDLLFVDFHPYLADGDPQALLQALSAASELEATVFVPGHGPLGTIEDVKLLMAYIESCEIAAQALVQSGAVNEQRLASAALEARFAHLRMPQFYRANLAFLCKRRGGGLTGG